MAEFLEKAPARIPNLAGIKFTNPDLMAYQQALRVGAGQWDLPFGVDEHFLGGMVMGAKGAVGSGFNFAAPVYHRLMAAYANGDLEKARIEQYRGVQIIQILASIGYMGAAKCLMEMLGVPVGPARLPNTNLTDNQKAELRSKLEQIGFFAWFEQK
jgi:N-acetylneuraminate lyase